MDKYEAEPKLPLALCFLLGIIIVFPAIKLEEFALTYGLSDYETLFDTFLYAIIGVALIEEGIKFLVLRAYPYRMSFFNEPMDGIVFSVMIAMGFATFENIIYADRFGLETTLIRAFTAVPAHATFAIIMGYYTGLAKFNQEKRISFPAIGLGLAILVHGIYDFFLMQEMFDWLTVFAILTLALAIFFAQKLIKIHQENSPFKNIPYSNSEDNTV
jgi:RsiW-degrading membrane proteinase PrsW (M82 family)